MALPRRDVAALVSGHAGRPALTYFLPPDWTLDAACSEVGVDLFFPEESEHDGKGSGYARLAKQVCATCPVRQQCLEYALAYESGDMGTLTSYPAGVYGGRTPRERMKILRERRAATSEAS